MDKQELQMAKKLNAGFRVLDDISDMKITPEILRKLVEGLR